MPVGPYLPNDVPVVYENFNGNQFEEFQYDRPRIDSIESSSRYDRDGSGEAVRIHLRASDRDIHNSRRAELQLNAETGEFKQGDRAWIGFSVLVPEGYETDPSFEIIFQLHSFPDEHLGEEWRSPPIALKIQDGGFHLHHQYDRTALTLNNTPEDRIRQHISSVEYEAWTDFALNVNYQQNSNGFIRLYQNGRQVYSYTGPVGYNDVEGMFTKIGIYKPDWKYNPQRSLTTERTLYFDAFRFARGDVESAEIDPVTIFGLSDWE